MEKNVDLPELKTALIRKIYRDLCKTVDPGIWWPAETRFEIFLGAILTQNTAWNNVEKSLNRLKSREVNTPAAIVKIANETLRELIRPSGFMTSKSANLQNAARWFLERDQQAQQMASTPLRQELLNQPGIGEETADTLLLYAYRRPVFIYDTYARRMFAAAGIGSYKNYAAARKALNQEIINIGFTQPELAEFHGLIVEAGKIARRRGKWPEFFFDSEESPVLG